jgi:hypothetical protein
MNVCLRNSVYDLETWELGAIVFLKNFNLKIF